MCKRIFCVILLLFALSHNLVVYAEGEVSFTLSDVSCEKNRIFETTLSSSEETAVFVATFSFDENLLSFRDASATQENTTVSVNSSVKGKVTVAWLCEEGTKGELLTLKFKSADADAYIGLEVEQAIDSTAKTLMPVCKGADVTVSTKSQSAAEPIGTDSDASNCTDISLEQASINRIELTSENAVDSTLIICICSGCVVVFGVGLLAFLIGRNTAKNNNNRKAKNEKDT